MTIVDKCVHTLHGMVKKEENFLTGKCILLRGKK